tara:strand:- start:228 stop:458 length:231 start_codon:yes stop_codon:yes gene_type:complete
MSYLLRTFGTITGCITVSYITLTAMMQDPTKPYRGHLNIRDLSKNDYIVKEAVGNTVGNTLGNMDVSPKNFYPEQK